MKVIVITGSVGTGKTTLARRLSKAFGYGCIDVNKIILKYGISEGYDRVRKCKIVDVNKLRRALIDEIRNLKNKEIKGIVIDSHLSHNLSKKYVDLCIITKCNLKILQKRLKKRGYSNSKIRENLDAEIFDVCLEESKANGHDIFIVDTTKGIKTNAIYSIRRRLNGKSPSKRTK